MLPAKVNPADACPHDPLARGFRRLQPAGGHVCLLVARGRLRGVPGTQLGLQQPQLGALRLDPLPLGHVKPAPATLRPEAVQQRQGHSALWKCKCQLTCGWCVVEIVVVPQRRGQDPPRAPGRRVGGDQFLLQQCLYLGRQVGPQGQPLQQFARGQFVAHSVQRLRIVQLRARQTGVDEKGPFKGFHSGGGAPQRQQHRAAPGMKIRVQQAMRCGLVQARQQALQRGLVLGQRVLRGDCAG